MSKLDDLCAKYTNTATDEEDEEFKQAVKDLFLELIGEDEPEQIVREIGFGARITQRNPRNDLRVELH